MAVHPGDVHYVDSNDIELLHRGIQWMNGRRRRRERRRGRGMGEEERGHGKRREGRRGEEKKMSRR